MALDPKWTVYRSRTMKAEYQTSKAGFREIAMGSELLASCMELATGTALPYAIQISPRDKQDYVRSWQVRPHVAVLVKGPDTIRKRVAAMVVNTAPHSALVEWGGSPKNPGYRKRGRHICRRVVEHLNGVNGAC